MTNGWRPFLKDLLPPRKKDSCPLIGENTTAGPLIISITAIGALPKGVAIHRSEAKPGDDIWISGTVGDAKLALLHCIMK
jgi:thiamine-monophosphate kinase